MEKAVEAGRDRDIVGGLRQVVVVARIAQLEAFDGDAETKRETGGVEAVGSLHLDHLAVAIAHAEEDGIADGEFHSHGQMPAYVVERACKVGWLGHHTCEGVGGGGGIEGVVVGEVPLLDVVDGKEEAEGGILQFVGACNGKLEGKAFGRAVEGEQLGTDVAAHEGGGKSLVVGHPGGGQVEAEGHGGVGFVVADDRFEVGSDGDIVVDGMAPTDDHHIVGRGELAGGLVVLVIAVETAIAAKLQAESESSQMFEVVPIDHRTEVGAGENIDIAQRELVVEGGGD